MIADIVLILIMASCIFLGYKKGLIKVGVRIISFVLALVIALILYTPISNYIIEDTEVVSNLKTTIYSKIYNKEMQQNETEENTNLAKTMENYIMKYTDEIQSNTSEYISEQIAIVIVRIGTWIGLFAISKVLLIFIRFFADKIAEIPIIKQFNKVRRYSIWCIGRICYNICCTCNFKHSISSNRRKRNN